MSNDFTNDKGQQLLGKVRVEFADRREMPQMALSAPNTSGRVRSAHNPGRPFNLSIRSQCEVGDLREPFLQGDRNLHACRLLAVGGIYRIPPTAHLIANRSDTDSCFLLVQGVGPYDFLRVGV